VAEFEIDAVENDFATTTKSAGIHKSKQSALQLTVCNFPVE